MLIFSNALNDWGSEAFSNSLKQEIEQLGPGALPLEKGAVQGGNIDDSDISATIMRVTDAAASIQVKTGVFFSEIVANCSCGDEPMSYNAYCEIEVLIDKATGEVQFTAL